MNPLFSRVVISLIQFFGVDCSALITTTGSFLRKGALPLNDLGEYGRIGLKKCSKSTYRCSKHNSKKVSPTNGDMNSAFIERDV